MTRFWIMLERGVRFLLECLGGMHDGEIFVPEIPSMRIVDLVAAVGPRCSLEFVGIPPGEKSHEVMVPEGDARNAVKFDDRFVTHAAFLWWAPGSCDGGKPWATGFRYSSDANDWWLTPAELRKMAGIHSE